MRTTQQYWRILPPAMALSWILFKCCYPFADFFNDSYTYIEVATDHAAVSYRPVGYSLFLELTHAIRRSDTFLVTVQYVLVQSACLALFFFLCRHCSLSVWATELIATFLVLNPLVYYISNYVSSDALFLALSLFWFVLLLRLIRRPGWGTVVLQWVLLAMVFFTRYTALFYPAVAAAACLLIRGNPRLKLAMVGGSLAVLAAGIGLTRHLNRTENGVAVFSAFSGWQMANNALHIYPWLPVDTTGLPSPDMRDLAGYVARYFERNGPALKKSSPSSTTAYMWEDGSPLHQYLKDYRKKNSPLRRRPDTAKLTYFTAWTRVAPVFSRYGYYLAAHHPLAFGRYYLCTSAESYFLSPLDVFAAYNEGKKAVDPIARDWFGYRSTQPRVLSATVQASLLAPFPWICLLLYLAFAGAAGVFLCRRELRERHPLFTRCLLLAGAYLLGNACFNILASPSVLRYQVLPMILLFIFTTASLFFRILTNR